MEIEEMKNLWEEMSVKVARQTRLTDTLIIEMTQERYKGLLRNISIPESVGSILCLVSALWMLLHFHKLDTWYLMACGIFSAGYLILMPIYLLRSMNSLQSINIAENTYSQTLRDYTKRKKQFFKVQRWAFFLNFILVFTILPVIAKISSNKNMIVESNVWVWYIPMMMGLLIIISFVGYRYSRNITSSAAKLLTDLEKKM